MREKIDIYRIYIIADWVDRWKMGLILTKEYRALCYARAIGRTKPVVCLLSKINPDICFQVPNFIYEYKEFKKQYWKEHYPLTKRNLKRFIKERPLPFDMTKKYTLILNDILKFESKMTNEQKLLLEVYDD